MKFTLSGFESFMQGNNDSIFAFINNPANFPTDADATIAQAVIMERYGEMETLYADPYKMKFATETFFRKHKLTFDKWFNAINIEYEPLYNFDRYEEWDDNYAGSRQGSNSDSMSANNTRSNSSTDQTAEESQANAINSEASNHSANNAASDSMHINESMADNVSNERNTTDSKNSTNNTANQLDVAAYNSSTLPTNETNSAYSNTADTAAGTENSTTNGLNSKSGLNTSEHTGEDSGAENKSGTTAENKNASSVNNSASSNIENLAQNTEGSNAEADAHNSTHRGHLYGNIGVTTSSALLMEYLDASQWSFYDHIADLYAEELLILVY